MWLMISICMLCAMVHCDQGTTFFTCPDQCICLSQSQVLCNNGGLVDIPSSSFSSSVEHLSLSKNHFTTIKTDAFSKLRNLHRLFLDHNTIEMLRPFAFRGLPRLKELSMTHNSLDRISQFTFAGLQNITSIKLTHNKIKSVEAYAFAGTSNIKIITLSHNPTQTIKTNAFSGLTNVEYIVLPSGIKNIEPDAFFGLSYVRSLKMAFLDLLGLKKYTFRGLHNVGVLTIEESDLGTIDYGAFEGIKYVDILNIQNNKIDFINEINIHYNNSINAIRFRGNHLLENPDPDSIMIEGVTKVSVRSNHFPCDCKIEEIAEGPLGNFSFENFMEANYCISPMEARGKKIGDFTEELLKICSNKNSRERVFNYAGSGAMSLVRLQTNLIVSLVTFFLFN